MTDRDAGPSSPILIRPDEAARRLAISLRQLRELTVRGRIQSSASGAVSGTPSKPCNPGSRSFRSKTVGGSTKWPEAGGPATAKQRLPAGNDGKWVAVVLDEGKRRTLYGATRNEVLAKREALRAALHLWRARS